MTNNQSIAELDGLKTKAGVKMCYLFDKFINGDLSVEKELRKTRDEYAKYRYKLELALKPYKERAELRKNKTMKRRYLIYNTRDFTRNVGCKPILDDLARANCPDAGKIGHSTCGVCEHNLPVFCCTVCFHAIDTIRYWKDA